MTKQMKFVSTFFFMLLCVGFFSFYRASISHSQGFMVGTDTLSEDYIDDGENVLVDSHLKIHDPYEKFNRKMFKFNHVVMTRLFNPLAKGYDFVVPEGVQGSVDNFFSNVRMPVRFFNNGFQGKFKRSSIELSRFLLNTTVGIGGLFDPAKGMFHLEAYDEDFGQTLGHYGNGSGPYIVWPILGPSTGRDTIGFIGDAALSPSLWFGVYEVVDDDLLSGLSILKRVNNYAYNVRERYETMTGDALDPYTALQHAFIEYRKKKIAD